jgi:hypothetical protein
LELESLPAAGSGAALGGSRENDGKQRMAGRGGKLAGAKGGSWGGGDSGLIRQGNGARRGGGGTGSCGAAQAGSGRPGTGTTAADLHRWRASVWIRAHTGREREGRARRGWCTVYRCGAWHGAARVQGARRGSAGLTGPGQRTGRQRAPCRRVDVQRA